MLRQRVLVAMALLPIGLVLTILGGPVFAVFIALVLALAAWEYTRILRACGLEPHTLLVVGGAALFPLLRWWDGFAHAPLLISLAVLAALGLHLLAFERGRGESGTDFGVSLGGLFYLGWIGAYFVSLRSLPEGLWWFLLALPTVMIADSAAFSVGRRWGKHHLSPRLSPKKTWEGYLGGVVGGMASGLLLGALYPLVTGPGSAITPLRGALLGLTLAVLTTLGDLGESMFKRQAGMKDSGDLLPGHGGVFDRIDSWLWAGVIAYYLITLGFGVSP
jgi:phosphatidate cytidylyltransferase